MKTRLRAEPLEARDLAGGLGDTTDKDHFLLPAGPIFAERGAEVWLEDFTLKYPQAGPFDDAHRLSFQSHLRRTDDPKPAGTASAWGYENDSTEIDYATAPLAPGGLAELVDLKAADLQKTDHAFYFGLRIGGKWEAGDSLSPPTPTPGKLSLGAPVDGYGNEYYGMGSYIRLDGDKWLVYSAVAFTNGYANLPAALRVSLWDRQTKTWTDAAKGVAEAPLASAGLRFAEFTVPNHNWCEPSGLSYYCEVKWTETARGQEPASFAVNVYVPVFI